MDGKCVVTERTPGDWGWVFVFTRGDKGFSVTPHHAYTSASAARRAVRRVANKLGFHEVDIKTYTF